MNLTLKAKAAFGNDAVSRVWHSIADHVTETEAWDAVGQAVREVRQVTGRDAGRVVYGWSGGKDSLALEVVMEHAGIERAVIGLIPHLEFRTYLTWIDTHQPEGLNVIANTDLTLQWLARPENDRYLFPRTSRDGYFWTLQGTRRAQRIFQREHHPPMQIYGRRRQDGNHIGRREYGIQKSRDLTAYCPLRDWPHELVLAVIHYAGRELPPVYSWPHGWTAGTGAWPGRPTGTREESWAETYAIEPARVSEAAEVIPSAREWLAANAA